MPLNSHQPVYKSTTTPADVGYYPVGSDGVAQRKPGGGGYLASSTAEYCSCCCRGRKKRLQLLVICGAVVAFACGLFLLIAGGASSQGGGLLAISVIVSLLLFVISAALFIVYFRSQGRCNLPCWPSRAERFSRTLAAENHGEQYEVAGTTVPVDEDVNKEKSNLMESDATDAEKIAESAPKVMLIETA